MPRGLDAHSLHMQPKLDRIFAHRSEKALDMQHRTQCVVASMVARSPIANALIVNMTWRSSPASTTVD